MKRDELFPRIAPPPFGLAKLNARLDARPRPLRVILPVAATLAIAAAIALIFAGRSDAVDVAALARARGNPSEIGLGLAKLPGAAVTLAESQRATSALAEVQTADRRVSFYWVSSTSWDEAASAPP